MTHAVLEERVGQVEQAQSRLGLEQARQGERLGRIEKDVGDVSAGVKQLLEREARRPESLSGKTIAATCAGLASCALVVWWLIGSSPAVTALDKRLDRLDDPVTGRVTAIERRVDKLDGWGAIVRRGER